MYAHVCIIRKLKRFFPSDEEWGTPIQTAFSDVASSLKVVPHPSPLPPPLPSVSPPNSLMKSLMARALPTPTRDASKLWIIRCRYTGDAVVSIILCACGALVDGSFNEDSDQ